MCEFTPSEYYRNYCKENGIEITDRDLAAAISNGDLDPLNEETALFEKFSALKEIAAETADNELKALVSEVIKDADTAMEDLKNGGENCIYEMTATILLPTEEELYRHKSFYFYNYDTAFDYALSHTDEMGVLRSFDIERLRIFTGDESSKSRNWEEHAYFNSSGDLLRIYGGKEQAFDKLCAHHADVNPFNDLDIVMHCRGGGLGIVADTEGAPRGEISVLFEDGYVLAVSPMCLEKIDGNSELVLRERAVKVIWEQLNRFGDKERAILEKKIVELSGS